MKKNVMYFLKRLAVCLQSAVVLVWISVPPDLLPEELGGKPGIVSTEKIGGEEPEITPQDDWNANVDEPEG